MQPDQQPQTPHAPRKHRKRGDEHDDTTHELAHDESNWLVSYADMMTLLFGFFVLMYSFSKIDDAKFTVVSKDVVKYFGGKMVDNPGATEGLKPMTDKLAQGLSSALGANSMGTATAESSGTTSGTGTGSNFNVSVEGNAIVVSLNSDVLFTPGSARPTPAGIAAVNKVFDSIKDFKVELIEIEGYTDADAISTAAFPSNWELSTARASSIVRIFETLKVPQNLLKATGYGSSRQLMAKPTATGEILPEAKDKQRRVVMNLMVDPKNKKLTETLAAKGIDIKVPEAKPEVPGTDNPNAAPGEVTEMQQKYNDMNKRLQEAASRLKEAQDMQKRARDLEALAKKTQDIEKKISDVEAKTKSTMEQSTKPVTAPTGTTPTNAPVTAPTGAKAHE